MKQEFLPDLDAPPHRQKLLFNHPKNSPFNPENLERVMNELEIMQAVNPHRFSVAKYIIEHGGIPHTIPMSDDFRDTTIQYLLQIIREHPASNTSPVRR